MAKCYILIGAPASGKTTWIDSHPFDRETVVASTDNFVESEAKKQGKTYNEVFKAAMPLAIRHMSDTVKEALADKKDIVWDQTSMSVASRAKKFNMLWDSDYEVIGVVFALPKAAELTRRLASRPGKTIPDYVMKTMIESYEEPTLAEGFNSIIYV
jgi:predicted kinase